MRSRDRTRPGDAASPGPGNPSRSGGSDGLRERAEWLFAIADRHIDEALSNDPEEFLRQNRQQGGQ
jgi:hypothetical protein